MSENSIPKEAAYQIINDELMLDGNPRLNLASFVTTWMEPECDKLIMDSINKNYVYMDEYPVTTELQVSTLFYFQTLIKQYIHNYTFIHFIVTRAMIVVVSVCYIFHSVCYIFHSLFI